MLQVLEQRFPCRPWRWMWWSRISPTAHGGLCWSRYLCCSPWRSPCCSRWTCRKESCGPKGVHNAAGSLAGTLAFGRPTLEQSVSDGLYPMERTPAGAVFEELYSVGFRLEHFVKRSRGRTWGGRSSRELTTTRILHISCIAWSRKESRRIRSDIKPVKNRVKSCVKVFSVLILFLSFLLNY